RARVNEKVYNAQRILYRLPPPGAPRRGECADPQCGAVSDTSLAQPNGTKSRIGVIGSGKIGGTIGGLWIKAGHPVMFSSRHPEELKDMVAGLGSLAQAGSVQQAVAFGDVMFVGVPYGALPQIGKDHAAALKNKIVLDACNAVA